MTFFAILRKWVTYLCNPTQNAAHLNICVQHDKKFLQNINANMYLFICHAHLLLGSNMSLKCTKILTPHVCYEKLSLWGKEGEFITLPPSHALRGSIDPRPTLGPRALRLQLINYFTKIISHTWPLCSWRSLLHQQRWCAWKSNKKNPN